MFRCRDVFGQSSKLVPNSVLRPHPVGVNALRSSDQIFQIAVIVMCPSFVDICSILGVEKKKKEEKTTMPCGLYKIRE